MIEYDEEALICDLAETYNIYDYRSHPLSLVATLSAGLREDSRIKTKASGYKVPLKTILLAIVADRIGSITSGKNEMAITNELVNVEIKKDKVKAFTNGTDFDVMWHNLNNGG